MRTIFVNPRRRPKRRKTAKRRSAKKANPRRRAKRTTRRSYKRNARKASKHMIANPRRRRSRKSRRSNPMVPFVRSMNPTILRNPGSLRRRRRNPGLNLSIKGILDKSLSYGGGSALGAGVNIIGLSKIENMWFRNAARLGVAVLGGSFLKGDLGAAMAGATLYPLWQEVALRLSLISGPTPFMPYPHVKDAKSSGASLDMLSADLQDVLDEAAAAEMYDNYN